MRRKQNFDIVFGFKSSTKLSTFTFRFLSFPLFSLYLPLFFLGQTYRRALEEYISAAQIDLSEDLPLFRALATPRSKEMVRIQGISYTRARELVKDAFKGLTDVSKLRLYSLRAGRVTSGACAGIPDRLFRRHGRWASENAKDGYVKDDFNSRLLVTRSLGI